MNNRLEKILSIPKSLYVSHKYCKNVPCWKLPVLVRWNCRTKGGGLIIVNGGGRMSIGFGNVGIYDKRFSPSILELNGKIVANGVVRFGHGCKICVCDGATLTIGDNFCNTSEARIVCADNITFKNNVLLGWETMVMDTDWHNVVDVETGKVSHCHKPIVIGENVWTGQKSTILKGVHIAQGCIIASCAVVTKSFEEENALIAGNPAVVKKTDVTRYYGEPKP